MQANYSHMEGMETPLFKYVKHQSSLKRTVSINVKHERLEVNKNPKTIKRAGQYLPVQHFGPIKNRF